MFSSRVLAVCGFALLAAAAAYPASDRSDIPPPITSMTEDDFSFPWMSISPFSLFAPLWKLIPSFADIGPRIYSDDDQFQVVVNVKDYRKEDLQVRVKGDLIYVEGSQEANNNNRDVFATRFHHTYNRPSNSSSSLITAKLTTDGFLVVTVPITGDNDDSVDIVRDVPIVETGSPYRRELFAKPVEEPAPTVAVVTTQTPSTTELTTTQVTTTTQAPTTTQEPTTVQTTSTTQEPTTVQTSTTTQTPTTPAPTESDAPITNSQTTTTPIPIADEEVIPIEQENATEKDNAIPHGNEETP